MRSYSFITKPLLFIAFVGFILLCFYFIRKEFFESDTILTEDVMVEKIVQIGKLELVKYSMKDVLERKKTRHFLPDKRILFVAVGEATGCVDLTKIRKQDIVAVGTDSITVILPQPEICYVKLDHKLSRVYDVSGDWLPGDGQAMVEGIYKIAEAKILENARKMDILGKTKENATLIFKPFLEDLSGKKVGISFR